MFIEDQLDLIHKILLGGKMKTFKKLTASQLLDLIQKYEENKKVGSQIYSITKKWLKKYLKAYFQEEMISILDLERYKLSLQRDNMGKNDISLTRSSYELVGKKEVLEAYEFWLGDKPITPNFEKAWNTLMHGNLEDPSYEKLEKIFTNVGALQFDADCGFELSLGQQNLLDCFNCCFPYKDRNLLGIVKQFFTLFRIYFRNIGNADINLTSLDKIKLASQWYFEQKQELEIDCSKEAVVFAYQAWLGDVPFEGWIDWSWEYLLKKDWNVNPSRVLKEDDDLKRIQRTFTILMEKKENDKELTLEEKQWIISYWTCFQNNQNGENMKAAEYFIEVFSKYYLSLGFNPYSLSNLEKIRITRKWSDEVNKKKERERKKCI